MDAALADLRNRVSDGSPLKKALFAISKETDFAIHQLKYQYYENGGSPTKAHGNRLLTDEQEDRIRILAVSFSAANMPWNKSILSRSVFEIAGIVPNSRWCRRWISANAKWVAQRKCKHLAKKRNTDGMLAEVESFIVAVEETQSLTAMSAHNTVNYDETRVCVTTEGEVLLERAGKARPNAHGTRPRVLGSLLTFVNAAGAVLVSFWIMKADFSKGDEKLTQIVVDAARYPKRGSWNRYYGFSDTGYVNNVLFDRCFTVFMDEWTLHNPGLRVFTFGDQLNNHIQVDLTRRALAKKVEMWLLPSNTSHFLQPLDHIVFANFKSMLRRESYEAVVASVFAGQNLDETLFALALQVEESAFSPRVIQKAFQQTGIWPWDASRIMRLARENAGELTPSAEDSRIFEAVDACTRVVKSLAVTGEALGKRTRTYTVSVQKNDLHSPAKRARYAEEVAERAAAQSEAKLAKVQEKIRVREEKKSAKSLKCCREEGCGHMWRGGKGWFHCENCSYLLCVDHKKRGAVHVCNK
jgi:hypothetical protein